MITTDFSKPRWFLNSRFDFIFLLGLPSALLILPLTYYLHSNFPKLVQYEYMVSNFPHVISTLIAAYLIQNEYKKNPVLFLFIPVIIYITALIFYEKYTFHFDLFRYYAGKLHIFIQYFFILLIFKLQYKDTLKIDKIIDTFLLVVGSISIPLYYLSRLQIRSINGSFYNIALSRQVLSYIPVLTGIAVSIFFFRQLYLLLRKKKVSIFKLIFFVMFLFLNYYPFGPFKNLYYSTQAVLMFHCLQYIAWVWLFCKIKFGKGVTSGHKFISYLAQNRNTALYFIFVFSLSVAHFFNLSQPGSENYSKIMGWSLALIHIYLDWLVWQFVFMKELVKE